MAHIRIIGGESVLNKPMPVPPSRGVNWNHEETQVLVDVWSEEEQLDMPDHEDAYLSNKIIYAKTAKRLREMGYERTKPQIQFKLKQLKTKYKGIMLGRKHAGGSRPGLQWEFFDQIDKILRRSKSKVPASSWSSTTSSGAPTSSMPRGMVTDTSAEAPGTSSSQPGSFHGKRTPASARSTAPSSAAPSTTSRATTSDPTFQPSSTAHQTPAAPPQQIPAPSLPEVPESDYEENEDEEDGDLEETEENDIRDLFAQNQTQGQEMNYSAGMSENNDPTYDPTAATNSAKPSKRVASSHNQQQHNSKKSRGRPKSGAPPPRDDLTVAQAITDAVMRFIDHQSHHLTEQTKLLQRYLKFERARMRWEMDMETRRMKWEEEREMREEERRQRQEELQAKRVSDNREFMLQMAVVLGNEAATGTSQDRDSTEN
ncbi:BZIP-type transcription factor MBZ1-like isoform X2 [Patiria miniata]|uniref:Myb/SANT-like DNA-binding domain-containing protein n=1 Tax=Patiria miniata TaxID=46514 RepID=A0A914A727_PATMI|nr:BZIP-type transcription factor MBZ1-like isoform X2 [Patiria miniata]